MKSIEMKSYEQILDEELHNKYPEECVELGENWELIAKIFYELGFSDGNTSSK